METGAPVLRLQQRVAALESQLAETIKQHTGEATELQNQIARLQSLLERSEAERQQLEYSLALAQQSSRQSEDEAEEKEREFRSIQDSLQSRVSKLTQQCQEWRSTLATVQQARAQERTELQHLLGSKEEQLSRFQSQCKDLECAKERLESDLTQEQSTIAELGAQVQHLEAELGEQSEALLGRGQKLEAACQRERKLQREIQAAQQKARALAESLEAEKGAHLGSKFSADIAQRQLHEAEGRLESEKAAHRDASAALEASRQRTSNLQSCLETESRKHQVLQEQLHSKELELQSLEQQLKEKQAVVSNLSSQLQLHKTNFDSLKEELTQAQAQQAQLEEGYNGCLKEVGDLIKQFRTEGSSSPSVGHVTSNPRSTVGRVTSAPRPSHLVEMVRQALAGSQAQLESTTLQLTAARQSVERLSEECSTYRQVVTSRTSAITEAEQRIGENCREISHLTAELGQSRVQLTSLQREGEGLKAQVASLRKEGEGLRQRVEEERGKANETKEKLLSLKKEHTSENEEHCKFLQSLHELLQSATSPSHLGRRPSPTSSWAKLCPAVNTTAASLVEALRSTKHEVSQLQSMVDRQHSELQSSKAVHKEAVAKLSHTLKVQEDKWTQRSTELKNHFEALLVEAEERTEKCRQCADEALQNAERLSTSNQQLESRLNQLQDVHQVYKNDRACLLACVSLLSGSLFPALGRVQQLVMEKEFLVKQVCNYQKLEAQVSEIVASITADIGPVEDGGSGRGNPQLPYSGSKCHPLLRFRKAAIAVVAAKRFLRLQEESRLIFSVVGVGGSLPQVPVCVGRRSSKRRGRVTRVVQPPPKVSDEDLARWLRSEKVLLEVRDSLSELQATLDSCTSHTQRSSGKEKTATLSKGRPELENAALEPARISFTSFLQKAHPHFQPSSSLMAAGSLWHRLGQGLAGILRVKMAPHSGYTTCTELGEALHTQLTSLVGRLHDGELERHSLHTRLSQSTAECQQLSEGQQQATELAEQLQNELKGMVPGERFEGMCRELQQALHREREAQAALEQQSNTTHQLQARLNMSTQTAQNKDSALSEAVKELSETRLAVQQWEQQARQAGRRLQQVEEEGQRRGHQLGETQAALQKAINGKEVIQEAIQHAELAFRQSKQWLGEAQSSRRPSDTAQRILKAAEEFASQRPNFGPEIDNCQLMLKSFVDAHQCALSCLATLHDQVASCEGHIATLKGELSAACRRQIAGVATGITTTLQSQTKSRSPGNEFFPLRECCNTNGSFERDVIPMALEELSLAPQRARDKASSPTDDPLLIASQGAKLGAELAKTLNL